MEVINKVKKTRHFSKKVKIIIGISILLIMSSIIGLFLYNINNNPIIFINSHENNAWTPVSYGYKIYANSTIEEYDNYNNATEFKKAKISDEDLKKLKNLANSVNSNYINGINPESLLHPDSFAATFGEGSDAGLIEKKIHNDKEKNWILLYQYGNIMGYNDTKETKEIIELTEQLYIKYLQDDI